MAAAAAAAAAALSSRRVRLPWSSTANDPRLTEEIM
jgi:hypothetical protein